MNTSYFLNLIAGHVYHAVSDALPDEYYLGLSSSAPTTAGGNVTEPSSSLGYLRTRISHLGAPSNGVVTNTRAIEFPTALLDWGVLTHFVVFDAQHEGHLLAYGPLRDPNGIATPVTVEEDMTVVIPADTLTLSVVNP